ncbi:MAG: hypothetical protein L0L69_08345, partial [Propionibacterium sp.]|nr:hypothetical protein [Propionibacterium sp.]
MTTTPTPPGAEHRSGLRSFLYVAQFPALVILPLFGSLGRAMLGSSGWMGVIHLFFVAVPMFVLQLVVLVLTVVRARRVSRHEVGRLSSWPMLAYGLGAILGPLGMSDATDQPGTVPSVLGSTGLPESVATALFAVGSIVMIIAGVVMVVTAIIDLRRAPRPSEVHEGGPLQGAQGLSEAAPLVIDRADPASSSAVAQPPTAAPVQNWAPGAEGGATSKASAPVAGSAEPGDLGAGSLEARPLEARPLEARPLEARPLEARPLEARPLVARPSHARPPQMRPRADESGETPSGGTDGSGAGPAGGGAHSRNSGTAAAPVGESGSSPATRQSRIPTVDMPQAPTLPAVDLTPRSGGTASAAPPSSTTGDMPVAP